MAYMSQERKKELAPGIKFVLKKYGMKASIAVDNHSSLVVNIKSGPINFAANVHWFDGYDQVNTYHIDKFYSGIAASFLKELNAAMNVGNFDNSDPYTDYFHVGWYTDINIGKWNKPYVYASAC